MSEAKKMSVIYVRTSPVVKVDSVPLEAQLDYCRQELNGQVDKEYIDDGFSGKTTNRPQLQQMMKDVEAGLIERVVVYKLDRFARNTLDFASLMDTFRKNDVVFMSVKEKFDSTTSLGRAKFNMCMVFEELNVELKAAAKKKSN